MTRITDACLLTALLALPLFCAAAPIAFADDGDSLPDFDEAWKAGPPSVVEAKLREVLPRFREAGKKDLLAQILTQIARTRGLQDDFVGAHALLDEAEGLLDDTTVVARIRYLLERGRVFNSSGEKAKSYSWFLEAYVKADAAREDGYAVDAVHMLAIVAEPKDALQWNELALAIVERSSDERAKRWAGALYNNIGWTWHDLGEYEKALACFERDLAFRRARGQERTALVARYNVARAKRSLGRYTEALAEQQALLKAWEEAGEEDGFVFEEVGECLLALQRGEEAKPYFARAHALLSKIGWLVHDEPERLARLAKLGGVEVEASGGDGG